MKVRLCGKIIKHRERYSGQQIQTAYETLICALRKLYRRKWHSSKGSLANYYAHKANEPDWFLLNDVNEIWCVKVKFTNEKGE